MNTKIAKNIDEYISTFPKELQTRLRRIRSVIEKEAPKATEAISYAMPTFKLNGNLVHFAGYANHIGFYPTPNGIEGFKEELSKYKTSKGAVQFQHSEEIPYDLIKRIVKYRVEQNTIKKSRKQ